MFDLILAGISHKNKLGIGYQGNIPWQCPDDLKLFKQLTMNKTLLMGRKTIDTIPILKGREILCWSKSHQEYNGYKCVSINDLLEKDIMVAGGAELYNEILTHYKKNIRYIHLSIIKDTKECDKFVDKKLFNDFIITRTHNYDTFDYYMLEFDNTGERQYLDLIDNIRMNGRLSKTRNGNTKSLFVSHMMFDLRQGFPLLTTKKMFFRGVVEELLFFLRGDTDSKILEKKGINIWKGNTSKNFIESVGLSYEEGLMGPMYGWQWRNFNGEYKNGEMNNTGIDQLEMVINLIREDPNSRRIMMTTFNPAQVEESVLYPCHSIVLQFYVEGEYLDMYCYNRSSDTFLGLPFNIASSSLLLMIISKITGKIARNFHLSLGDCHIYENHFEQVEEQLGRIRYKFPKVEINGLENINDIDKLVYDNFVLRDYNCHSVIKAEMVS